MAKTDKAPWFVHLGNVLTLTLLRAGFKLRGPFLAAYKLLRSRGAQFITPPFDWREETRAFFLDPDGLSWRSGRCGKPKGEANEHVCVS